MLLLASDVAKLSFYSTREEIRQYWEERNRNRFDRIAAMPRKPGKEALWAKLEEQKASHAAEKR